MTKTNLGSRIFLCLLVFVMSTAQANDREAKEKSAARLATLGREAAPFELEDFEGKSYSLKTLDDQKLLVVAFLGTECPLVQLYAPQLNKLASEYKGKVQFVGMVSNRHDSLSEIAAFARRHQLSFPVLKDTGNRVADQLAAERTPEVFLLDVERKIRYRGRIDDRYGVGLVKDKVQQQWLVDAVNALLAGRKIEVPVTEAVGCHIGRLRKASKDSRVTYHQHVRPLLQKHCIECHREGQIAPFALQDYEEVAGWAPMIDEVVREQRMPPWHADPQVGEFVNARQMTADEKKLIYDWVAAGAPEGERSTNLKPTQPVNGEKVALRFDKEVKMRPVPFRVPSEGVVQYQYYIVDPKFKQDRWVSAAWVEPGNRAVVHHCIVFVRPPDDSLEDGIGWLTGYVPGQHVRELPPSQARFIPAGSKLIFQMHYTVNGRAQDDLTKLRLKFADPKTVKERVYTVVAINRDFEIEPHAEAHSVPLVVSDLPSGGKLQAIAPHMHVRGKAFRFEVEQDGKRRPILNVPNYDFNWQHAYRFKQPVPITDDFKVHCLAVFDNSANNLANPDPNAKVRWGDQTFEEMVLAYFEVAVPVNSKQSQQPDSGVDSSRRKKAQRFISKHDRNGDGKLVLSEVPDVISVFVFGDMDLNNDDVVTLEEAMAAIRNGRLSGRR